MAGVGGRVVQQMGFQFGDYLESVWIKEIYPAFVAFKEIFGHSPGSCVGDSPLNNDNNVSKAQGTSFKMEHSF